MKKLINNYIQTIISKNIKDISVTDLKFLKIRTTNSKYLIQKKSPSGNFIFQNPIGKNGRTIEVDLETLSYILNHLKEPLPYDWAWNGQSAVWAEFDTVGVRDYLEFQEIA